MIKSNQESGVYFTDKRLVDSRAITFMQQEN